MILPILVAAALAAIIIALTETFGVVGMLGISLSALILIGVLFFVRRDLERNHGRR
jgi:hypothetical protein